MRDLFISTVLLLATCAVSALAVAPPHLRVIARKNAVSGSSFPTTNLVAFWKLDEASGNALDTESGSHDGVENSSDTIGSVSDTIGTTSVTVRELISASSEYFAVPDAAAFDTGTGAFTFAGWVKINTGVSNNSIHAPACKRVNGAVGQAGWNTQLSHKTSGRTDINAGNSDISDGTTEETLDTANIGLANNTWGHFIFIRDGANWSVYVNDDGTPLHSETVTGFTTGSVDNASDLWFGRRVTTYSDIRISHFGFWDKALDGTERSNLYNNGEPLPP